MSTDHSKFTRGPEKLLSQVKRKTDIDQPTFTSISSGNISVSVPIPVHLTAITVHLHTIDIGLILPSNKQGDVQGKVNDSIHNEVHQVTEVVPIDRIFQSEKAQSAKNTQKLTIYRAISCAVSDSLL